MHLTLAMRQLMKHSGFTAMAMLTLALGIGANTAVFSVLKRVLLHPPPWKDPQRLVSLWERAPQKGYEMNHVGPATFLDWKSQNQSFQSMAAFGIQQELDLTGDTEPECAITVPVTANLFQMMGVPPLLGRDFSAEEETLGRDQVVLISHALWQRRFQADPQIIGRTLRLNGQTRTIVGVMPPGFAFPGRTGVLYGFFFNKPADLWIPLAWPTERWLERSNHALQVLGRLKPDVAQDAAAAEMDGLMSRIAAAWPDHILGTHVKVIPLHEQSLAHIRHALALLLGAVAFVLLIACANLTNLFLARAAGRRLEFGIRLALGAQRRQIISQLLAESVLLALFGGALGILLAHWGVAGLAQWAGDSIAQATPGWRDIRVDQGVLAFTLLLSIGVGVFCGLVPAWQASRVTPATIIQGGTRSSMEGSPRHAFRRALVAVQTAVALTLVIGAGLLLQSFLRLQGIDPGFDPQHVLTLTLNLPEHRYSNDMQRATFFRRLAQRVQGLPDVQSVGATSQLPLSGDLGNTPFAIVGRPPPPLNQQPIADLIGITPDYATTMGIGLVAGRSFEPQDTSSAPQVCLVNQTLVRRHFGGENPIGRKLQLGLDDVAVEIVGVIQDIRQRRLDYDALTPALQALLGAQVYLSYVQAPAWPRMTLVIKASDSGASLMAAVRAEVRTLDANLPVSRMQWMETVRGNSIAEPRLRTWLVGLFGGLALALAAIGTYSVMAFSVACRTHEMGVRIALGARRLDVLALVVRQGMRTVWIGLAAGLIGAFALTRLLTSLLYHTSPTDVTSFAVVTVIVASTALLACYLPAQRASRVQPMEALRQF